jgi:DNA polymerase-3 subunit alpha
MWKQMEEFARYSFNKAHAYGYAVLGVWTAWLKENYPEEFYVAVMSTVDNDRLPDFVEDARANGFSVLPPDINDSIVDFNSPEAGVIRYGFQGVSGIGPSAAKKIIRGQPYLDFDDYLNRSDNIGVTKTLVKAGAFDSTDPNRKWLEQRIAQIENGDLKRCVDWNPQADNHGLPCNFDWSTEPVKLGKRGQPLKAQPIPKKCTIACRHYRPNDKFCEEPAPYSSKEIRELEREMMGTYLSSTPFDAVDPKWDSKLLTSRRAEAMPEGIEFTAAVMVQEIKERTDKNGKKYAFVKVFSKDGPIEAVCFASRWGHLKGPLTTDDLIFGSFDKTNRGYTLQGVASLDQFRKMNECL